MENSKQQCNIIREEFIRINKDLQQYQERLNAAADNMNKLLAEKEEAEEKLRQRSRLESIGMLIGGIAHNFNNALSIISGNLHILKRNLDDDALLKYIDNANGGVTSAADLVQQLLSYSKAPAISPLAFSLYDNVFKTCKLIRSATPSAFTVDVFKTDEDDDYGIIGYPSQIQEVILNLTTNAVQATKKQGEILFTLSKVTITQDDIPEEFDYCSPGTFVKLNAADNGPGIPKDILDKIFEPFFTTKKQCDGTGIGLATVKKIVERHQGMIFVDSSSDGASFDLFFPVSFKKITEENIKKPKQIDKQHNSNYLIMIVDDDDSVLHVISGLVDSFGFNTETFTNPKTALVNIIDHPDKFNLVLTDYVMPNMDGVEMIQHIHAIDPKLKFIIISGTLHDEVSDEFKKHYNVIDVIDKPINDELLLSKIQTALNIH